jgi:hypothetical protein
LVVTGVSAAKRVMRERNLFSFPCPHCAVPIRNDVYGVVVGATGRCPHCHTQIWEMLPEESRPDLPTKDEFSERLDAARIQVRWLRWLSTVCWFVTLFAGYTLGGQLFDHSRAVGGAADFFLDESARFYWLALGLALATGLWAARKTQGILKRNDLDCPTCGKTLPLVSGRERGPSPAGLALSESVCVYCGGQVRQPDGKKGPGERLPAASV